MSPDKEVAPNVPVALLEVRMVGCEYREIPQTTNPPPDGPGARRELRYTLNVTVGFFDPRNFETTLEVVVETKGFPAHIAVAIQGRFASHADENAELEDFAAYQAPTILYPFAREAIANLTMRTRGGVILLPALNVPAMLRSAEPEAAK